MRHIHARTCIKDDNSSFVAVPVLYPSSPLIAEAVVGHLIRFTLGFPRERERTAYSVSMCTKKKSECSFQTIASSFMRFLGT